MNRAEAKIEARLLRRKLRGKGWKLRVWSNGRGMSWHVAADHPCGLSVMIAKGLADKTAFYWTLFNPGAPGTGNMAWSTSSAKYFRDPNNAVRAQLLKAGKVIRAMARALYEGESLYITKAPVTSRKK